MYRAYFLDNFTFADIAFDTLGGAISFVVGAAREAAIFEGEEMLGAWTPGRGYRSVPQP